MEVIVFCLIVVCFYNYKIVAAFRGMHVSPAKHSFRKCDRRTDRRTDGQWTKLSLCVAMLRRRHKNPNLGANAWRTALKSAFPQLPFFVRRRYYHRFHRYLYIISSNPRLATHFYVDQNTNRQVWWKSIQVLHLACSCDRLYFNLDLIERVLHSLSICQNPPLGFNSDSDFVIQGH